MTSSPKRRFLFLPDMVLTALFTALISLAGTVLKLPLPPPAPTLSMQFCFCALAGVILGAKAGGLSVLLYLILGLLGLPVFTQGGGPAYILLPSFGYLAGFFFCAVFIGFVRERCEKRIGELKVRHLLFGCLGGLLLVYLCGVGHLLLIRNLYLREPVSLWEAIWAGALIFALPDLFWCLFAAVAGKRLLKIKRSLFSSCR